ncbi:FAD dependent oxidoreductase [Dipodascopsis uninucleata]
MASLKRTVVIGAGVAGLTTALQLAKTGKYDITVVAKFTPGDYDIEYTSPWAGANWMCFSVDEYSEAGRFDVETYKVFKKMLVEHPEAGIWHRKCICYTREKDLEKNSEILGPLINKRPWFSKYVDNFEELSSEDLPAGIAHGFRYDSFCLNIQIYLPWLQSQCTMNGVKFKQCVLKHIKEAKSHHLSGEPAELIVNCTGLMACKLGGVMDSKLYPGRGQVVLVRNVVPAMYEVSGTDDADDELTYIMSRPGGGTVLGGCFQPNNWNPIPDPNMTRRIVRRCLEICPDLEKEGPIDIIRAHVGLRPVRVGGARLELDTSFEDLCPVIHNYGAGGAGYQSSYGMADTVVSIIEKHCI